MAGNFEYHEGIEPPTDERHAARAFTRELPRVWGAQPGGSDPEETGGQEIEDDQDELEREGKERSRDRRAERVRRQGRRQETSIGCRKVRRVKSGVNQNPPEALKEIAPHRRIR